QAAGLTSVRGANLCLIHLSVTNSRALSPLGIFQRGRPMTGTLIAECVLRIAAALALLGFSGCTSDAPLPSGQPSFYRNLAEGGQLDPAAAQSMISGYRANNGLGAVALDPDLMKLAEEHSRNTSAAAVSTPRWRWRTFRPATTRLPRRSRAGATRRRIAPTCCTRT